MSRTCATGPGEGDLMSTEGGTRAIVAALTANLGIAATKFLAFLLTQSSSMLAESIHSVADSGNQLLLLIGGRRAARLADEEHPFGYGRQRYVYAFLVSIVLFSVGGLFAIYEGVHKWQHPEPIEGRWWWVPLAVLVVEMNSLIIGESADADAVAAIRAALVGGSVESVIHMRTMHLGPEELLVAAKIAVRGSESAAEVAAAIDEAERRVRAAVPIARVI